MAQLLSGILSTATYWRLDEIPDSDYLRCGDEIVRVLTRHPVWSKVRVRRGAEGTTAAAHDEGDEVTAAYVVGDSGGEQTVRLLRLPFTFADVDLNGNVIFDDDPLPAEALVLSADVLVSTTWTWPDTPPSPVKIGLGLVSDPVVYDYVTEYGTGAELEAQMQAGSGATAHDPNLRRKVDLGEATVLIFEDTNGPSAGAAHLLVLVAEPA